MMKLFLILSAMILIIVGLIGGGGVFLGYQLGAADVRGSYDNANVDLYAEAWSILSEYYYKQPVSEKEILYGALSGMAAALNDPYSQFFNPEQAQELKDLLGKAGWAGVGVEWGIENDRPMVIRLIPDAPAEKAGVKPRDMVYAIDGKDTKGVSLNELTKLIGGEKDTKVTLTIVREGWKSPKNIAITRQMIWVNSVEWEMKKGGIVYIKLSDFYATSAPKMRFAAAKIYELKPRGIILDLRDNTGGYLEAVLQITSLWIPGEKAVVEKSGDGKEKISRANGTGWFKDIKTVILINGNTASASEILAGALRDYGKAILVGEKTFGKGIAQMIFPLKDGSLVKITTSEWFTPKGISINKKGIEPDIQASLTKEDVVEYRDPQLERAMEVFLDK